MELTLLELEIEPDLSGATLYAPFSRGAPAESDGSGPDAGLAGGPGPLSAVAVAAAIAAVVVLWRLARRDGAEA